MTIYKHQLPNGNELLWLGTEGVNNKNMGVNHILVLSGGEVLFLKTIKSLSLWDDSVKNDILTLPFEHFIRKYDFPNNQEVWKELKEGVKSGNYPAFAKMTKKQ